MSELCDTQSSNSVPDIIVYEETREGTVIRPLKKEDYQNFATPLYIPSTKEAFERNYGGAFPYSHPEGTMAPLNPKTVPQSQELWNNKGVNDLIDFIGSNLLVQATAEAKQRYRVLSNEDDKRQALGLPRIFTSSSNPKPSIQTIENVTKSMFGIGASEGLNLYGVAPVDTEFFNMKTGEKYPISLNDALQMRINQNVPIGVRTHSSDDKITIWGSALNGLVRGTTSQYTNGEITKSPFYPTLEKTNKLMSDYHAALQGNTDAITNDQKNRKQNFVNLANSIYKLSDLISDEAKKLATQDKDNPYGNIIQGRISSGSQYKFYNLDDGSPLAITPDEAFRRTGYGENIGVRSLKGNIKVSTWAEDLSGNRSGAKTYSLSTAPHTMIKDISNDSSGKTVAESFDKAIQKRKEYNNLSTKFISKETRSNQVFSESVTKNTDAIFNNAKKGLSDTEKNVDTTNANIKQNVADTNT